MPVLPELPPWRTECQRSRQAPRATATSPSELYLSAAGHSQVLQLKHADFSFAVPYQKAVGVLSKEYRCEGHPAAGKAGDGGVQAATQQRQELTMS